MSIGSRRLKWIVSRVFNKKIVRIQIRGRIVCEHEAKSRRKWFLLLETHETIHFNRSEPIDTMSRTRTANSHSNEGSIESSRSSSNIGTDSAANFTKIRRRSPLFFLKNKTLFPKSKKDGHANSSETHRSTSQSAKQPNVKALKLFYGSSSNELTRWTIWLIVALQDENYRF